MLLFLGPRFAAGVKEMERRNEEYELKRKEKLDRKKSLEDSAAKARRNEEERIKNMKPKKV